MTAPKGTAAFTTEQSKASEKIHTQWVSDVVSEFVNLKIRKSISVEEIIGKRPTYALQKNGKSTRINSDGGFIYKVENGEEKLVGVAENKFQTARANAVERASKYALFMDRRRIFISCAGVGFIKGSDIGIGGSSTGTFIDLAINGGVTLLENVTDEKTFKDTLRTWVRSL
jgi:hypothetical protein